MRKVLISGAGLGGLCLAQALRQAGVDVELFERDHAFWDRPQGYRLHLDVDGLQAIAAALPPALHDVFTATAMTPAPYTTIVDPAFRVLRRVTSEVHGGNADTPGVAHHANVDRATLRQSLFHGLEGATRFGERLVRYATDAEGVTAPVRERRDRAGRRAGR